MEQHPRGRAAIVGAACYGIGEAPEAPLSLFHANGGTLSSQSTVVLGTAATL